MVGRIVAKGYGASESGDQAQGLAHPKSYLIMKHAISFSGENYLIKAE